MIVRGVELQHAIAGELMGSHKGVVGHRVRTELHGNTIADSTSVPARSKPYGFIPPQLPSSGRRNESETLGAHVRSRFKVDHDAEGYRVKALYICGNRLAYKIRHRLTSAEKGSLWIRDGSDP
jgi:hypothetical protein